MRPMRPMRPTLMARWTAAQRSRLARSRPSTPGGAPEVELALDRDVRGPLAVPLPSPSRFEERTRFVDAEVARAIGHGVAQVVVLGAGYDGRALRFGGSGPRWFEVDHPETQVDKRRRLSSLGAETGGVTYVGVDPVAGDVGGALGAAGHDALRPSLFVCEALFDHATLEEAANLCTSLRDRAPEGSTLAATFLVEPAVDRGAPSMLAAFDRWRDVVTATSRSDYRAGDPGKLMVVTGWGVIRSSSSPQNRRGAHLVAVACEPSPLSAP
jgi:methyltransferase (TIGR00027 family)